MIGDIVIVAMTIVLFWPLLFIPLFAMLMVVAFIQDGYNGYHGRTYDPQLREYK
jgi:hypothetical protein